jgi:hypothetical protein
MNKTYKDFKKEYIGSSDVAALTMVGYQEGKGISAEILRFSEDGDYDAYIVEGAAEIGEHYTLVAEFDSWLKIYDDDSLKLRADADIIKVYRAGQFGCIIQILNN